VFYKDFFIHFMETGWRIARLASKMTARRLLLFWKSERMAAWAKLVELGLRSEDKIVCVTFQA
jgi:hypothetical protein